MKNKLKNLAYIVFYILLFSIGINLIIFPEFWAKVIFNIFTIK